MRLALCLAVVAVAFVAASCSQERPTTEGSPQPSAGTAFVIRKFGVRAGSHPHDVAPGSDGTVWYTAQSAGALGRIDPKGADEQIPLGSGSSPHGVIVGPDGAAWVTDTGLNAIVRVDAKTEKIRLFRPSDGRRVGMHTATFDRDGILWFTGSAGFYGRLDPDTGVMRVFEAPGGSGPYGITATPGGDVYFASLQRHYIARVDPETGDATTLEPPTRDQGARRVWSDSDGRIWVTEWLSGKLARYDPASDRWREWNLPAEGAQPYAVFVDDRDIVWVSDFRSNAILAFDPKRETFSSIPLPSEPGEVRQLLGRKGEVWGAESAADSLVVIETR